jgi:hypothetical protein
VDLTKPANGLLLRTDIHRLFDRGYVTPDFKVEVSGRLREQFENGRTYYALDGTRSSYQSHSRGPGAGGRRRRFSREACFPSWRAVKTACLLPWHPRAHKGEDRCH